MAAFVIAVDRGSLAAASRQLGYPPAAVTQAIASLEDRLGAQLTNDVELGILAAEDYVAEAEDDVQRSAAIQQVDGLTAVRDALVRESGRSQPTAPCLSSRRVSQTKKAGDEYPNIPRRRGGMGCDHWCAAVAMLTKAY